MFSAKPLVFVSYSRKDKAKVDDLGRRLASRGVRTWVDTQDIVGGEWRQNIKRALRHSNFFIACLSRNTVERGEVLQYELDSALEIQRERLEGEIYLIPVRLDDCETPQCLSHLQCVDLFEPQGWERLLRAVRSKSKAVSAIPLVAAILLIAGVLAGYFWLRPSTESEFVSTRSKGKSAPVSSTMRLGITLWKMEQSKDSDPPSTREIVHTPATATQSSAGTWTPVRLATGEEFRIGDTFQAGIETSRTGFLYVVNRSLRADGSTGAAFLIYPTNRIHGGDNQVWPGRLVRLPDRNSDPPYWTFSSTRTDYVGELFMVLLVPHPIETLTVQDNPIQIDEKTIADWVNRYGSAVSSKSYNSPAVRLTAEEAAARDEGAQLPTSAPLPQIVFEAQRAAHLGMLAMTTIMVKAKP